MTEYINIGQLCIEDIENPETKAFLENCTDYEKFVEILEGDYSSFRDFDTEELVDLEQLLTDDYEGCYIAIDTIEQEKETIENLKLIRPEYQKGYWSNQLVFCSL